MAENTRMKEMQTQLASILNWIEKQPDRDKANRDLLIQFQTANNDRMDQMQKSFDLLNQGKPQHIVGSSSNLPSTVRDISLGFPHFDGTTPVLEWIFKAEKFFNYHRTPDQERVDIASIHFEKDVIPWFQMLQRMSVVQTWPDLTRALESHFGPSPFDSPMAELFKLYQSGTVSEYYLKFMALANRSEGLSDAAVLNCFLSGLNRDVRRDVVAQCPTTLLRAVSLAKLYEEKYIPVVNQRSTNYNHRYSPLSSTSTNLNSAKTTPKQALPPLLPTPTTPPIRNSNVKKISPAEMQLRREKGLCYFCDEKFTFNHKCPNRQLLMLQTEEEDFAPDNDSDIVHSMTPTHSEEGLDDNHHLSLNAMHGGLGAGTIRFTAHINTLPVTVLVDGGSSDNFLQPRIAKFLKLAIEPAPMFKVMVGNGNYMTAEGMIKELKIQAQGAQFELPVFLLPIQGADLILGANWLKTIGSHIADYDSLQLKLLHEGKFITLQGESDCSPTQAHLHHIRRM
ncbi:Retrotransposon gag domain, partial [Sesbania bispinosa]